jgi:hypothetical protein
LHQRIIAARSAIQRVLAALAITFGAMAERVMQRFLWKFMIDAAAPWLEKQVATGN